MFKTSLSSSYCVKPLGFSAHVKEPFGNWASLNRLQIAHPNFNHGGFEFLYILSSQSMRKNTLDKRNLQSHI